MDLFDWARHADRGSATEASAPPLPACDADQPAAREPRSTAVREPRRRAPAGVAPATLDLPPQTGSATTAAAAIAVLRTSGAMPAPKLARLKATVTRAARRMGRTLETLPLAPAELTPLLKAVRPGGRRFSDKTWSNERSSLRALAVAVGAHAPKRLPKPLGSGWQPLVEAAMPNIRRSPIIDFVRWCEERGTRPEEVTEATVEAYRAWRAERTYTPNLPRIIVQLRAFWNGAARKLPGWPQRHLATPGTRKRQGPLSPQAFPESFAADLAAYEAKLRHPSPLKGRARALAEPTIELYRRMIMIAATTWAGQRGGPDKVPDLACLVSVEAMEAILLEAHGKAGGKWTPSAEHLACALVGVARDHLAFRPDQLEPLRALQRLVVPERRGRLPEAVRGRLAQFDQEEVRTALFNLASKLCEEAEALLPQRPREAASRHRRGIMLYFLLQAVLRRRDLITLRLDQDFLRDDAGRPVALRRHTNKTGALVHAEFSPRMIRALARHLGVFRPLLPGADGPWLFAHPSGEGHASPEGQGARLAEEVRRRLGVEFNLHLTRHIVASILYEAGPGNVAVVQSVLGHTDAKTTSRMYGELNTLAAHRVWSETLDRHAAKRQTRRPPPRGKR
ncbi:MAG TPA: site-specific integrase [Crenalkalicoccus sp.]|nr:site-specific integrase [Crenalkalicoccus sp.]